MAARFSIYALVLVLAGFLITACFGFDAPVADWLALGVGCAVVALGLTAFALTHGGPGVRVIDATIVLAAAWLIVASRCFGAGAARWISFGDAALLAGLALSGLIAHEATLVRRIRSAGSIPEVGHRNGHNGVSGATRAQSAV